MKLFTKKTADNYGFLIAKEAPNSYVTESLQKLIVNLEYANIDQKI